MAEHPTTVLTTARARGESPNAGSTALLHVIAATESAIDATPLISPGLETATRQPVTPALARCLPPSSLLVERR